MGSVKISEIIENLKSDNALEKNKSESVIQTVSVKSTQKLDEQKELLKQVENNGFRIKDFISNKAAVCYCAGCKKERSINKVFYGTYKNGVSFVRGTCAACGSECWKTLKE